MTYEINFEQVERFWNWLRCDYPKDAYTEIKLMDIKNTAIYNHVQVFAKKNPNIIIRKNCQFFIKDFGEIYLIMSYENNLFCKHSKMCYSIEPKFMVNGDIAGSYEYLKISDMIFLDIEKYGHEELTQTDIPYISGYINAVIERLKQYGLIKPLVIASGGGYHVLYKIRKKKFTEKRKLGYKQFITELEELNTEIFKIDHCVDLTRCIAIPESINTKRLKKVIIVSEIPEEPINDFYIKMGKKVKHKAPKSITTTLPNNIRDSVEWKIIIHPDVPKGSVHTILLFALKLLIREMKIPLEVVEELEDELNAVRDTEHKLNLEIGIEGKQYNEGIIINWMSKNYEWCQANDIYEK